MCQGKVRNTDKLQNLFSEIYKHALYSQIFPMNLKSEDWENLHES